MITLFVEQPYQSVSDLANTSIKLAEASANVGALKVIFGVFLVFMILMVLFFFYQTFTLNRKVDKIYISSGRVSKYFEEEAGRTIGKPQAIVIIRRIMASFSQNVKYVILRSRVEGFSSKEILKSKIRAQISNEFNDICSFLDDFEYEGKSLSFVLNSDDANIIVDYVIEQILLDFDNFKVSEMDQATDILIKGITLEYLRMLL